jgi:hypothetical protein
VWRISATRKGADVTVPRVRASVAGFLLALVMAGALAGTAAGASGIEGAYVTNSPFVYMLTTQMSNGTLIVVLLTLVPASGVEPAFTVWEYAFGPVPGGTSFSGVLLDPTTPADRSSSITIIFAPGANPPTAEITIIDRRDGGQQRTTFLGTKVP